jgi:O-antigen/teichoic acid export membrane protein
MTRALRHPAALFSANAANHGVALVVTLVAAQQLSTADFGALGLALALVVVMAALGDWGSGVALVRAVGREPGGARCAAAAVLAWKLLLLVALAVAGLVVPLGAVAEVWPALAGRELLATTLVAVGLLGCWTTRRAIAQAHERFSDLRRDALACAALRAAAFAGVAATDAIAPVTVLLCLYVIPQAVLLAWHARALRAPDLRGLPDAARSLLRYCGWVGASSLCFIAFTRAPLLALGHGGSPHELGVLGAALTLAFGCALVGDALRTFALPRLVRAAGPAARDRARAWVRRTTWPILALAAAGLLVLAAVYEALLGPAHTDGAPLVLVIGLATLLTAGVGLENALVHALGRPALESAVNAARLAAFAVLATLLPATALAMALAFAGVMVAGELLLALLVRRADRPDVLTVAPQPQPQPQP